MHLKRHFSTTPSAPAHRTRSKYHQKGQAVLISSRDLRFLARPNSQPTYIARHSVLKTGSHSPSKWHSSVFHSKLPRYSHTRQSCTDFYLPSSLSCIYQIPSLQLNSYSPEKKKQATQAREKGTRILNSWFLWLIIDKDIDGRPAVRNLKLNLINARQDVAQVLNHEQCIGLPFEVTIPTSIDKNRCPSYARRSHALITNSIDINLSIAYGF